MLKNPKIEMAAVDKLLPYVNNPKAHPPAQVDKIASSIKNFGFLAPIVIDKDGEVVAGHGRLLAAKKLDMKEVPCIRAEHLTPAQARAYRIADNKLAESEWFPETLAAELKALAEMDFDLDLTGFSLEELHEMHVLDDEEPPEDPGPQIDRAGELQEKWQVKPGDIWGIGQYTVCPKCGKHHRMA